MLKKKPIVKQPINLNKTKTVSAINKPSSLPKENLKKVPSRNVQATPKSSTSTSTQQSKKRLENQPEPKPRARTETRTLDLDEIVNLTNIPEIEATELVKDDAGIDAQIDKPENPLQGTKQSVNSEYEDDYDESFESDFESDVESSSATSLSSSSSSELSEQNYVSQPFKDTKSRGIEILSKITLDIMNFELYDVVPVSHDIFMQYNPKTRNTRQNSAQTISNFSEKSTETDTINTQIGCSQTFDSRINYEKEIDKENAKNIRKSNNDYCMEDIFSLLNDKSTKIEKIHKIQELKDEDLMSKVLVIKKALDKKKKHELRFDQAIMEESLITQVYVMPKLIITVHEKAKFQYKGIFCVWHIADISQPIAICTSHDKVTCLVYDQPFIYGGLESGCVTKY